MTQPETTLIAIDGTDALAFVVIRPGAKDGAVGVEAAAKGLSKTAAAHVLRHVASQWEAEAAAEQRPPTTPAA